MRAFIGTLIALVWVFAEPALAQRNSPAVEVAAALSLAQAGIDAQKASTIVTALEVLASFKLMGEEITEAKAVYTSEARFLMRGDAALARRLDAASQNARTDATPIWVSPLQETFTVPPSRKVRAVATTSQGILLAVKGGPLQVCKRGAREWLCGFAPQGGRLTIEGFAPKTAWLVIQLASAAP